MKRKNTSRQNNYKMKRKMVNQFFMTNINLMKKLRWKNTHLVYLD